MESLLFEPQECPSCPGFIASMDPHHYSLHWLQRASPGEMAAASGTFSPLSTALDLWREWSESHSTHDRSGGCATQGRWHPFFSVCFFRISRKHGHKLCLSRLSIGDYHRGRPSWADAAPTTKPLFVSPALSDIWQYIEASWHLPLKTKFPVSRVIDFLLIKADSRPPRTGVCSEISAF